jgi:predicted Fe-S protein YdhL (DUF1289 family)
MDPTSGLCAGCYRTLEEIAAWSSTNDERRACILLAVEKRRQAAQPSPAKDH